MAINNNCQPCAPVPTVPLAPPPTCPGGGVDPDPDPTGPCPEYVSSSCVVSPANYDCTAVYNPATGPDVPVGLDINVGTTLSQVYEQLTGRACPTSIPVIGAILQTIGVTGELKDIFCQLVCECISTTCSDTDPGDDPGLCANVSNVSFTNVTTTGFTINFFAVPGYTYIINMVDTTANPDVTYTRTITALPGVPTDPGANYQVLSSSFPNATTLPSGHTFVVTITATYQTLSCTSNQFTTSTVALPTCDCTEAIIELAQGNADPGEFVLDITYSGGNGTPPVQYNVTAVKGEIDLDFVVTPTPPNLAGTTTTYTSTTLSEGVWSVTVTPVCSITPSCIGDTVSIQITVPGPQTPSCSPPDITNIVIS